MERKTWFLLLWLLLGLLWLFWFWLWLRLLWLRLLFWLLFWLLWLLWRLLWFFGVVHGVCVGRRGRPRGLPSCCCGSVRRGVPLAVENDQHNHHRRQRHPQHHRQLRVVPLLGPLDPAAQRELRLPVPSALKFHSRGGVVVVFISMFFFHDNEMKKSATEKKEWQSPSLFEQMGKKRQ